MPGQKKIVSVMKAPSMIAPIWIPIRVTTGIRAFFSACRVMTVRSRSPFARAVRMYSCPNTSRRLERTCRRLTARLAVASVTAGSTRRRRLSPTSWVRGMYPPGGKIRPGMT